LEATLVQQIEFGPFILDRSRECLLRDGDEVRLRPQSFRMLNYRALASIRNDPRFQMLLRRIETAARTRPPADSTVR
jgi:hypothetical protein